MPRKDPAVGILVQYGTTFQVAENGDVIMGCTFQVFDPDTNLLYPVDATVQFNSLSLPGQIDSDLVTACVNGALAGPFGTVIARSDVYLPTLSRGVGL